MRRIFRLANHSGRSLFLMPSYHHDFPSSLHTQHTLKREISVFLISRTWLVDFYKGKDQIESKQKHLQPLYATQHSVYRHICNETLIIRTLVAGMGGQKWFKRFVRMYVCVHARACECVCSKFGRIRTRVRGLMMKKWLGVWIRCSGRSKSIRCQLSQSAITASNIRSLLSPHFYEYTISAARPSPTLWAPQINVLELIATFICQNLSFLYYFLNLLIIPIWFYSNSISFQFHRKERPRMWNF